MRIFIRLLVVFVILGVVAMVPMFINWDSYTAEFEQKFKKDTGFDLKVEGGITFKLFPKPNLYLKDIKIGELLKPREEQVEIVKASGVELHVKYIPLFFKSIIPIDISLHKPQFYARHKTGTDIDIAKYLLKNIVRKEDVPQFDLNSTEDVEKLSSGFNFNKLNMSDGIITIESEQFATTYTFEDVKGKILVNSASGPFDVELGFNYKNAPYSFSFNASELSKSTPTNMNLDLSRTDNRKANFKVNGSIKDRVFTGSVSGDLTSLSGDIEPFMVINPLFKDFTAPAVFNITLNMLGFFEKVNGISGTINTGNQENVNSITRGGFDFSFDETRKLNGKAEFSQIDATPFIKLLNDFVAKVDNNSFVLPKDVNGNFKFMADVITYNGSVAKKVDASFLLKEDALVFDNFSAILPGNGNLKIDGKLNNSEKGVAFKGKVDSTFDNVEMFMKWIGKEVVVVSPNTYRKAGLKVAFDGSLNDLKIDDLFFRLDNMDLSGKGSFERNEDGSIIKMALDSKTLILDPYVKRTNDSIKNYRDFLTVYIEKIKNFLPINYDIQLKTNALTYMGGNFSNFALDFTAVKDKILVRNMSADDVGGMKFNISGGISKTDNSLQGFKAEVDVKNVINSDMPKFVNYLGIVTPNLNKLKSANLLLELNGNSSNLGVASAFKADTLTVGVNGNFSDKYKFEIDITHPNFKTFLGLFEDYYYPENAGIWFKFRTTVANDGKKVVMKDIVSSVGSMKFTGQGAIEELADGRKFVDLDINAPELIIDTFLPKEEFVFWTNNGNKSQVAWSKSEVNLSALEGFDAKLNIVADRVEVSPLDLGRTLIKSELSNKNLTVSLNSDEFYQGKISASASVGFVGEPTAKISLNLENAKLLAPLFNAKSLDINSGTVSLKSDLTMMGKNMFAMYTGVNGSGNLKIENGNLSGFSLAALEKYHNIVAVENSYVSEADLITKISNEVQNGNIDFAELKGQFVINNGMIRLLDSSIVVPKFETKIDNIMANLSEWAVDIAMSFTLPKMTYPPLTVSVKGMINDPKKVVDGSPFAKSLAKISADNKEFAEAKARQNLNDVKRFYKDAENFETKAKNYVDELKEMSDKDTSISPIYENASNEFKGIEALKMKKNAVASVIKEGVANTEDVEKASDLHKEVEALYKRIEASRANTIFDAAKVNVQKYAKDAMASANAVMSLVANNPDNDKVKEISEKTTENAVKAEVLVQKVSSSLNPDELKRIQVSVVELAVENIRLEALARDEIRSKNTKKVDDFDAVNENSSESVENKGTNEKVTPPMNNQEIKAEENKPQPAPTRVEPVMEKPKTKGFIIRH